jgi:CAP-Gly domain-containing linker protein 1
MSASQTSSATQIDNETLRDQVHHLQRKVATMEDILEDAHATSEKEEAVLRERMKRLKDKEEAMKKELNEGRKEVERMFKSEVSARSRVEEIEEALRESTVALENARAEVEILRAELTVSDLNDVYCPRNYLNSGLKESRRFGCK